MPNTFIHRWPPSMPPTDQHKCGRIAWATLPARISADAALLAGMTVGGSYVGGSPNPCQNWQGGYGHDHSGGYYGRPFQRSICNQRFALPHTTGGNIDGGSGLGYTREYGDVQQIITPPNETVEGTFISRFRQWIPNCDPDAEVGAFHELDGQGMIQESYTNTTGSDTITLRIINHTLGDSTTCSGISAATAGNDSFYFSDLPCLPGAVNDFEMVYDITTAAGGSNRTTSILLLDIEFGVEL